MKKNMVSYKQTNLPKQENSPRFILNRYRAKRKLQLDLEKVKIIDSFEIEIFKYSFFLMSQDHEF